MCTMAKSTAYIASSMMHTAKAERLELSAAFKYSEIITDIKSDAQI